MKASLLTRVIAYLIDIIILSAILTIITSFIPNSAITELTDELNDITNNILKKDTINIGSYLKDVSKMYYQIDIKSMIPNIIGVFLSIMYFMYYQFKNEGQTIGKKLMKIKIIKNNGKLELNDLALRSLLINGILFNMIIFAILIVSKENNYYMLKFGVQIIQSLFIVITVIMVLFRKDKRGLHDVICNTSVIDYRKEE